MVAAYILIDVKKGFTERVVEALSMVDNIQLLSVVTGEFDIIIRVVTDELEDLYQLMIDSIDPIEGVNDTITSVVEKEFK
ncbi:MAG: Lrp/AsnC ligand binding domain-containing protein [Candidatus Heimdallarchaeota archaeon]|nr:Lrp/AsnC ligand binding domain-containing protein [Candidatus Heimdallarchaeota archaeon]MCK5049492.1 Lrp/AsnC ligand binding domain-containing protein [Candidatus Heimdallarchaeota archaeon]